MVVSGGEATLLARVAGSRVPSCVVDRTPGAMGAGFRALRPPRSIRSRPSALPDATPVLFLLHRNVDPGS